MSTVTPDEAIEHVLERSHQDCSECAREHRQLAEWLSELKELREKQKGEMYHEQVDGRPGQHR